MGSSVLYNTPEGSVNFLTPKGTGQINVVDDFAWTLSPKSARADVPYVELTEYQQTTGQLAASLLYYSRIAVNAINGVAGNPLNNSDPSEVYKYKYLAEPTKFVYRFPYFSSTKHSRQTNFSGEDSKNPFQSSIDLGKTILGFGKQSSSFFAKEVGLIGKLSTVADVGIAMANTIVPGNINFEFPQKWVSTSEGSITIKFHLFNTVSLEDIDKNRDLAYILTYQNSASRRNFALNDPVVIYSLRIPDVVHFPACYMDSLVINNIGNTRLITNQGVERIIPEAYEFNMTFRSLIMPSRNIMLALDKGLTVKTFSTAAEMQQELANSPRVTSTPSSVTPVVTPPLPSRTITPPSSPTTPSAPENPNTAFPFGSFFSN